MSKQLKKTEEILQRSHEAFGSHSAVIDTRGSCTYSELLAAAHEVRDLLVNKSTAQGSVVGVAILEAREFLAALFGILLHGSIAIPISPLLPDAERARVIRDTGVSCSISTPSPGCFVVRPHDTPNPRLAVEAFPAAAVIRHTSGTTGRSKGVVLSHQAVIARCETSRALLGVTHEDRVLAPLPLPYHFIASALSFLQAGATIIDSASLSPFETLGLGHRHGATLIYGSPVQYELLSRVAAGGALSSLRRAISTSALLPKTTAQLIERRFAIRLTQVYGIIEVGLPIWNDSPHDDPAVLGACQAPYEAKVIGEDGIDALPGEPGELVVRGPGLFSGYLFGDGAGASVPQGDWFRTGDIVSQDEQGLLSYRGRTKSVINCGGNKVYPEEIEEVLRSHPSVQQARVLGESHPLLGSIIVAQIVLNPDSASDEQGWRSLCSEHLSGFKVPKEFRIVVELPMTGSGKVVRHNTEAQEPNAWTAVNG